MSEQLETRSEFARRAGVSPSAITQACEPGKPLRLACVGDLIDLGHDAARAYLRGKGIVPPRPATRESDPGSPESAEPAENYDLPAVSASFRERYPDVSTCLDLPLRVIVDEFGTVKKFREATAARKEIAAARSQEIKNAERIGVLIEREFVAQHVFGAFEELSKQLLGDSVRTLTRTNFAAARSNQTLEQAEAQTRQMLSLVVRRVKEKIVRKMNGEPVRREPDDEE